MNKYTALNTKIRGMTNHLLTEEDWMQLQQANSLRTIYQVLSNHQTYQEVLAYLNAERLSVPLMTEAVVEAEFVNFYKMYLFADQKQRDVLRIYGLTIEADFIHRVMKFHEAGLPFRLLYPKYIHYLDNHAGFDTAQSLLSTNMQQLIQTFQGTDFAPFFENARDLFNENNYNHHLFEETFERYLYVLVLKKLSHELSGKQQKAMLDLFGTKVDIDNLAIIYRLKFYYHLSEDQIREQLLPYGAKLNDQMKESLIQAADLPTYTNLVYDAGYGDLIAQNDEHIVSRKEENEWLQEIQARSIRQMPNSLFPAIHYLEYKHNNETLPLVRIIEHVGFQIS
ncbi:MAG: V-type ATPase subunit [Aerococcus sp.]|nr:V-type ATPase subunit [Aerococcus sp.]